MMGVEFDPRHKGMASRVAKFAQEEGLLLMTAGAREVVRFLPPLVRAGIQRARGVGERVVRSIRRFTWSPLVDRLTVGYPSPADGERGGGESGVRCLRAGGGARAGCESALVKSGRAP